MVPTFLLLVLRNVRVALSTGFGEGEYRSGRCPPASDPVPFGQASQPFGLVFLTVAPRAFACKLQGPLGLTTHSYLLPGHPSGLGVWPGFLPASRIEDQSLPWGRRISLFTSAVGNLTPHRAASYPERSSFRPVSPSFVGSLRRRFRRNVSQTCEKPATNTVSLPHGRTRRHRRLPSRKELDGTQRHPLLTLS